MIKKLRLKFILVSMLAITIVMVMLIGVINIMNYRSVVNSADRILAMLTDGGGRFPGIGRTDNDSGNRTRRPSRNEEDFIRRITRSVTGEDDENSPELRYESRFFSVMLSIDGTVTNTRTDRISAVDSEDAALMAKEIYSSGSVVGFKGDYRYRKTISPKNDTILIIFYDCGRSLSNARTFLITSVGISLICLLLVYILITLFSKAVIRPTAEAYEKQKQFITDAGHELKTPLAIINADADVLEMELDCDPEAGATNEWLEDIRKQTARLTELTGNLIYLAKTEEGTKDAFTFVDFPVSDVVAQEAESFKGPAQAAGKNIDIKIEENLSMNGDQKAVRQLVDIFMDNAIKYSPDGGTISVKLKKTGRYIGLSVTNSTKTPVTKENTKHMFDRFYRTDASRNSDTGGYGIGLSIAKSIVEAHKGKITANSQDENKLTMTAVMPS
ncbi:MAG: HAMP domain-containing histidine kinase [Lachnospiraceae bacterium]|nr:HAMP domain-containing histidine kinase [Lachnospiraceae bacterium]MBR3463472.1 HAMP domain-containing histidine kinase [Clostridiales bacterium]